MVGPTVLSSAIGTPKYSQSDLKFCRVFLLTGETFGLQKGNRLNNRDKLIANVLSSDPMQKRVKFQP